MHELPYSHEAEMALLGSLLMYPESYALVFEMKVEPDDFHSPVHQIVFERMKDLTTNDRIIDVTTLVNALNDHNVLERIGGVAYLTTLAKNSSSLASLKDYIEIVQEKSQKRKMIQAAQQILELGYDTTMELDEYLDSAERKITEISRIRRTEDMQNSKEVVKEFLENLRRIREQGDKVTGIKTGYGSLNNITNGLQRGDLIILAARPSVGKTAFALNLGLNAARYNEGSNGEPSKAGVAVFSLEMPATHLMSRMIAAQSGVENQYLRSGYLNDQQLNDLNGAASILSSLNIFIDDSSVVTMTDIFAKCRKLKAEGTLDIVIIDYIQLISSRGRSESRQQEVSEISRGLKQLAREMEVPVIALSQLSRNVEKRDDKMPQLSDLRESGSIEQDADIVMFLYREDYYKDRERNDGEARTPNNMPQDVIIKISKHRNGALGEILMKFNPSISKFYDVDNKTE